MKKLSRGARKSIRNQKGLIRRTVSGEAEQKKAIEELYKKFPRV